MPDAQMEQVERRLLKDEDDPAQAEGICNALRSTTRWVSKRKAGKPVEFGVSGLCH